MSDIWVGGDRLAKMKDRMESAIGELIETIHNSEGKDTEPDVAIFAVTAWVDDDKDHVVSRILLRTDKEGVKPAIDSLEAMTDEIEIVRQIAIQIAGQMRVSLGGGELTAGKRAMLEEEIPNLIIQAATGGD